MASFIIVGATSDIAKACLPLLRQQGFDLILLSRKPYKEEKTITKTSWYFYDAVASFQEQQQLWDKIRRDHKDIEGLLCCVGVLGDQQEVKHSLDRQEEVIKANYLGLIPLISLASTYFVEQGHGHIVGISSVAGERGRGSNYCYGSAKAGFTAYLSGLRQDLKGTGVHVLTVKPGLVQTKMIEKRKLPPFLCAKPEKVAQDIVRGILRNKSVLYSPGYWAVIMFFVRALPEGIYRHLSW